MVEPKIYFGSKVVSQIIDGMTEDPLYPGDLVYFGEDGNLRKYTEGVAAKDFGIWISDGVIDRFSFAEPRKPKWVWRGDGLDMIFVPVDEE